MTRPGLVDLLSRGWVGGFVFEGRGNHWKTRQRLKTMCRTLKCKEGDPQNKGRSSLPDGECTKTHTHTHSVDVCLNACVFIRKGREFSLPTTPDSVASPLQTRFPSLPFSLSSARHAAVEAPGWPPASGLSLVRESSANEMPSTPISYQELGLSAEGPFFWGPDAQSCGLGFGSGFGFLPVPSTRLQFRPLFRFIFFFVVVRKRTCLYSVSR